MKYKTFEVVLVVLLFDVFAPVSAHPLLFLDNLFVQIYSVELYISYLVELFIHPHSLAVDNRSYTFPSSLISIS